MPTKVRARFIVDSRGRRTAVVLPMKEFQSMLHELEDSRDARYVDDAEASAEGFVELSELRQMISNSRQ